MQNQSHLPALVKRLDDAIVTALQVAMDDIIPPWCSGIKKDFWQTPEGNRIAEILWFLNGKQALTRQQAIQVLFPNAPGGHARKWYRRFIMTVFDQYPFPAHVKTKTGKPLDLWYPFYVLRSDLDTYDANWQYPESITPVNVIKRFLLQNPEWRSRSAYYIYREVWRSQRIKTSLKYAAIAKSEVLKETKQ